MYLVPASIVARKLYRFIAGNAAFNANLIKDQSAVRKEACAFVRRLKSTSLSPLRLCAVWLGDLDFPRKIYL